MTAGANTKRKTTHAPKAAEVGIRISVTPRGLENGRTDTEVGIETDLPITTTVYVPSEWRRFGQRFVTGVSKPLAVAGNELLAAPPPPPNRSRFKDTVRWVPRIANLPGVTSVRGTEGEVSVFSG